jgi:hypothetical protein
VTIGSGYSNGFCVVRPADQQPARVSVWTSCQTIGKRTPRNPLRTFHGPSARCQTIGKRAPSNQHQVSKVSPRPVHPSGCQIIEKRTTCNPKRIYRDLKSSYGCASNSCQTIGKQPPYLPSNVERREVTSTNVVRPSESGHLVTTSSRSSRAGAVVRPSESEPFVTEVRSREGGKEVVRPSESGPLVTSGGARVDACSRRLSDYRKADPS